MRNHLWVLLFILVPQLSFAGLVEIKNNQLYVDHRAQPQLFGAEVQYFRMRGGVEKNIPRAQVISLWAQALDRVVEAKMNAISFYIPWDFHEYASGKFDFDGSVDEDGDGKPDYPSRDLKTFIKMVNDRGIKHILIRPGPYVNAEWGFLGFGAVPLWFHEKYPESHMQNAQGLRTKLYDYANPDLLRETKIWFTILYNQVLKDYIGPGKPISFLQIDNETNYMWQSLYNHDYSPASIKRYQDFLKAQYGSLNNLNRTRHSTWQKWDEITAPTTPRKNIQEDQDWYRFADQTIFIYLQKIRGIWESLGVKEPNILFTLADSYNATANGLLPNYLFHDSPGKTGLMTVNLYPKTFDTDENPLLNLPFKADHDVKAAESASEFYFGTGKKWAMGPEIQGGWWKDTRVTPEARRQTYLSVIGHGLKALFVYYFNEGDQWQSDWAVNQIKPIYQSLLKQDDFRSIPMDQLPQQFWDELQGQVDQKILVGFDAQRIMKANPAEEAQLYFDAPLDRHAQPRNHYWDLKEIGEKIVAPYGEWLAKAVEVHDSVCLLKDVGNHVPSREQTIDNVSMNSDWSAGLVAYALHAGINPRILHWGMSSPTELDQCQVILLQDSGISADFQKTQALQRQLDLGHTLVNFLDNSLANNLGLGFPRTAANDNEGEINYSGQLFDVNPASIFTYSGINNSCSIVITHKQKAAGYRCLMGRGRFYQIGALLYDVYNSNQYSLLQDFSAREGFFDNLLKELNIHPNLQIGSLDGKKPTSQMKLVAFARQVPKDSHAYITVKNGDSRSVDFLVKAQFVESNLSYKIKNLLSLEEQQITGKLIRSEGFSAHLDAFGSNVFWLEPQKGTP